MAQTPPIQIRLSPERLKNLVDTSKVIGMTVPDTHRLALDFGLPVVRKRLAKQKK